MSSDQINQIITQMGTAIGADSGLGGTLKFDSVSPAASSSTEIRAEQVDGRRGPERRLHDSVSLETFEKMVKGELDGTSAFMQGKLRVAGDMAWP